MGAIIGAFLSKFIPSFFDPKEHMLKKKPANNPVPLEELEHLQKAKMETLLKMEELEKQLDASRVTYPVIFKASRFKDPFTPDKVTFTEKGVSFRIWSLFEFNDKFIFYSDISTVEVVSGLFFATIIIKPKNKDTEQDITISNFTRKDAQDIQDFIKGRLFSGVEFSKGV